MRKYLLLGLIVFMSAFGFMTVPHQASAASTVLADVTFNTGAPVDSTGATWTVNGTPTYNANGSVDTTNGDFSAPSSFISAMNSLSASGGNFYIEVKFTTSATSGWSDLFHDDLNNLEYQPSGRVANGSLAIGGSSTYLATGTTSLSTSYDSAISYSNGTFYSYLNGSQVSSATGQNQATSVTLNTTSWGSITSFLLGGVSTTSFSGDSITEFKVVSGTIYTASSTQQGSVTVQGSGLGISSTPISWSNISFSASNATQNVAGSTITLDVNDQRLTGAGWNIAVSSTNLQSTVTDPSGGSGDVTFSIPASDVSIATGSVSLVSGQAIDPTNGPLESAVTLSSSPQDIASALSGYGMGEYSLSYTTSVTVPSTVTVAAVTGTGSKYTVGDTTGIIAGNYTGTLTFSVGSGI